MKSERLFRWLEIFTSDSSNTCQISSQTSDLIYGKNERGKLIPEWTK